jgi:dipeptidyl aminopeptidase/acylaminoacyl peptidase
MPSAIHRCHRTAREWRLFSFAGGASDIWTQNIDGTELHQLTKDRAADSWPVWSPDGRSIAFTSVRDGAQQTWVVPSDGGASQKLIDGFFRGDWIEKPEGAGTWIVTSNNSSRVRLIDVEKRIALWEERVPNADLPLFQSRSPLESAWRCRMTRREPTGTAITDPRRGRRN